MDFFEHQDAARRNTARLVVYFILAVICIVGAVYLASVLTYTGVYFKLNANRSASPVSTAQGVPDSPFDPPSSRETDTQPVNRGSSVTSAPSLWHPGIFAAATAGTLFILLAGSLSKMASLRGGGGSVAEMLGGRLIPPATRDPRERRLINVVEEMAIASSVPVPPVYLLEDEEGINAFAAGFSPSDAVIGVTRGTVQNLSRDELQGVIAHEFSHILNGDMRLNLRLIGTLHGILLISLVGVHILRGLGHGRVRSSRSSGGKGGGGAILAILVLALALMVIGWVGVFFAKLIKSAVSRQREFLADASAVQFTRNPSGIAGALWKIQGLSHGARIENANAETASHMFFGNALGSALGGMLATHPPLKERIQRLDPGYTPPRRASEPPAVDDEDDAPSPETGGGMIPGLDRNAQLVLTPAVLAASVGAPTEEHVAYAKGLRSSLPLELTEAAREPFSARGVVYGLILDHDPAVRACQFHQLQNHADPPVFEFVRAQLEVFIDLEPQHRLPLLDLCLPALQQLSDRQSQAFQGTVTALIEADEEIDLFEFMLQKTLARHMGGTLFPGARQEARRMPLTALRDECAVVLSVLARVGESNEEAACRAFRMGCTELGQAAPALELPARETFSLERLDHALARLGGLPPEQKRRLIQACTACVAADHTVTVREAELLRIAADCLGCPVPPVLPTAQPAG